MNKQFKLGNAIAVFSIFMTILIAGCDNGTTSSDSSGGYQGNDGVVTATIGDLQTQLSREVSHIVLWNALDAGTDGYKDVVAVRTDLSEGKDRVVRIPAGKTVVIAKGQKLATYKGLEDSPKVGDVVTLIVGGELISIDESASWASGGVHVIVASGGVLRGVTDFAAIPKTGNNRITVLEGGKVTNERYRVERKNDGAYIQKLADSPDEVLFEQESGNFGIGPEGMFYIGTDKRFRNTEVGIPLGEIDIHNYEGELQSVTKLTVKAPMKLGDVTFGVNTNTLYPTGNDGYLADTKLLAEPKTLVVDIDPANRAAITGRSFQVGNLRMETQTPTVENFLGEEVDFKSGNLILTNLRIGSQFTTENISKDPILAEIWKKIYISSVSYTGNLTVANNTDIRLGGTLKKDQTINMQKGAKVIVASGTEIYGDLTTAINSSTPSALLRIPASNDEFAIVSDLDGSKLTVTAGGDEAGFALTGIFSSVKLTADAYGSAYRNVGTSSIEYDKVAEIKLDVGRTIGANNGVVFGVKGNSTNAELTLNIDTQSVVETGAGGIKITDSEFNSAVEVNNVTLAAGLTSTNKITFTSQVTNFWTATPTPDSAITVTAVAGDTFKFVSNGAKFALINGTFTFDEDFIFKNTVFEGAAANSELSTINKFLFIGKNPDKENLSAPRDKINTTIAALTGKFETKDPAKIIYNNGLWTTNGQTIVGGTIDSTGALSRGAEKGIVFDSSNENSGILIGSLQGRFVMAADDSILRVSKADFTQTSAPTAGGIAIAAENLRATGGLQFAAANWQDDVKPSATFRIGDYKIDFNAADSKIAGGGELMLGFGERITGSASATFAPITAATATWIFTGDINNAPTDTEVVYEDVGAESKMALKLNKVTIFKGELILQGDGTVNIMGGKIGVGNIEGIDENSIFTTAALSGFPVFNGAKPAKIELKLVTAEEETAGISGYKLSTYDPENPGATVALAEGDAYFTADGKKFWLDVWGFDINSGNPNPTWQPAAQTRVASYTVPYWLVRNQDTPDDVTADMVNLYKQALTAGSYAWSTDSKGWIVAP